MSKAYQDGGKWWVPWTGEIVPKGAEYFSDMYSGWSPSISVGRRPALTGKYRIPATQEQIDACEQLEQADKPAQSQGMEVVPRSRYDRAKEVIREADQLVDALLAERAEARQRITELEQQLALKTSMHRSVLDGLDQERHVNANLTQQIAALTAERNQLAEWKRQQLIVSADFQAIGQELGIGLGQSVHDKILPGIQSLKSALEELVERVVANKRPDIGVQKAEQLLQKLKSK